MWMYKILQTCFNQINNLIIVLHSTLAQKVKVLFFYHKRRNEMSYKLVIAEKPSVAQSIAKVIGADKREDRYLEARRRNQNDK